MRNRIKSRQEARQEKQNGSARKEVEMMEEKEVREEEPEQGYEQIFLDSAEKAEWIVRTITALDAVSERVRQNARAIIKANRWHRDWLLRRFGAELEQWCREKLGDNPKSKTVQLLHGTVSFRRLRGRMKLVDPEAALEYLGGNGELFEKVVEVAPKIKAAAYIKAAEETGEALPGLEYVPQREAVYICGHRIDGNDKRTEKVVP